MSQAKIFRSSIHFSNSAGFKLRHKSFRVYIFFRCPIIFLLTITTGRRKQPHAVPCMWSYPAWLPLVYKLRLSLCGSLSRDSKVVSNVTTNDSGYWHTQSTCIIGHIVKANYSFVFYEVKIKYIHMYHLKSCF